MVRFSWATVRVLLEKQGSACAWADDVQQPSAKAYFTDTDKGRPKLWRDLGVSAVGEL
jgi:ribonuclease H2 subunit A